MLYDNTIGYKVVNAYLNSCFDLKADEFESLLSQDVEIEHTTNGYLTDASGRSEVVKLYQEHFFKVTSHFDIHEVNIKANGLQPKFVCKVSENKNEKNITYRAEFIDSTTLNLVNEEGKWKIGKIISDVSKKILEY